jgi:gas vesicle protein
MNFILGLFLGVGLGLIFAPARGEVTRRRIAERIENVKGRAVERGRETAGDVSRQFGERLFDKAVGEET